MTSNDTRDAFAATLASLPAGIPTEADIINALQDVAIPIIEDSIDAISDNIEKLASRGACRFLVPNAPPIGLTPAVSHFGAVVADLATTVALIFCQALELALQNLESAMAFNPCFEIVRLDIFTVVNDIVEHPLPNLNVTDSCITPGVILGAICHRPDWYLFWDGIHPTRAGHAILAEAAELALMEQGLLYTSLP